jgi:hypothetical protein
MIKNINNESKLIGNYNNFLINFIKILKKGNVLVATFDTNYERIGLKDDLIFVIYLQYLKKNFN